MLIALCIRLGVDDGDGIVVVVGHHQSVAIARQGNAACVGANTHAQAGRTIGAMAQRDLSRFCPCGACLGVAVNNVIGTAAGIQGVVVFERQADISVGLFDRLRQNWGGSGDVVQENVLC